MQQGGTNNPELLRPFCCLLAACLLTNLAVASVQHIAQLHHHRVAAHPADVAIVLSQHTRHLQARQRLLQVTVDVADCGQAGRWRNVWGRTGAQARQDAVGSCAAQAGWLTRAPLLTEKQSKHANRSPAQPLEESALLTCDDAAGGLHKHGRARVVLGRDRARRLLRLLRPCAAGGRQERHRGRLEGGCVQARGAAGCAHDRGLKEGAAAGGGGAAQLPRVGPPGAESAGAVGMLTGGLLALLQRRPPAG